jgi:hypothetical protein
MGIEAITGQASQHAEKKIIEWAAGDLFRGRSIILGVGTSNPICPSCGDLLRALGLT